MGRAGVCALKAACLPASHREARAVVAMATHRLFNSLDEGFFFRPAARQNGFRTSLLTDGTPTGSSTTEARGESGWGGAGRGSSGSGSSRSQSSEPPAWPSINTPPLIKEVRPRQTAAAPVWLLIPPVIYANECELCCVHSPSSPRRNEGWGEEAEEGGWGEWGGVEMMDGAGAVQGQQELSLNREELLDCVDCYVNRRCVCDRCPACVCLFETVRLQLCQCELQQLAARTALND